MPPAGGRFGPQVLSAPFSHIQQNHLLHHANQHQPPGSAGLTPPNFSSHPGYAQGNQNSALTSFSPANGASGLTTGFGINGGLGGGGGTGLASQAAMAGFAQGAALQQREAMRRASGGNKGHMKSRIRDVWKSNLAQEMANLRELVEKYPYISMVSRLRDEFYTRRNFDKQYIIGYRVSWNSRPPNGGFYDESGLSLSDASVQRGPFARDTARHNVVL